MLAMAELRNGVLYIDSQPVIALGTHYYPSYHAQKVPVPENGDRLSAMKEDIANMKAAGFHVVRTAALGEVFRDKDGAVHAQFPFVDAMLAECKKQDMGAFVRLQGYDVNLSGITDGGMLDQEGRDMPPFWGWFVRNCLNHPGILKDNEDATVASAAYFKGNDTVLGYQIYNEPGYPSEGFYDYNPYSIKAWRKWLTETGRCDEAAAAGAEPPRKRPAPGEDGFLWESWRLFHFIRMNDYLNHLAHKAKEGWEKPATFTCLLTNCMQQGSIQRGGDFFRVAQEMDMLGITHYLPCKGASYFEAGKILDAAESAAAVFGKHAWAIEYNGHTALSPEEWERETYTALGSGIKGIMYYQWRADYPFADGPEPEGYGMVYNDGTPTKKYDRALAMNRMITKYGSTLAAMEKKRSGVAILVSENISARCDTLDNGGATLVWASRERSYLNSSAIYGQLRRNRIPVDFTRSSELTENLISCRLLILPTDAGLSEMEKSQIEAFAKAGNTVVLYNEHICGYQKLYAQAEEMLTLEELLLGIKKPAETDEPLLDIKILEGKKTDALFFINYSASETPIAAGRRLLLRTEGENSTYRFVTPQTEETLAAKRVDDGVELILPAMTTGGMLLVERQ